MSAGTPLTRHQMKPTVLAGLKPPCHGAAYKKHPAEDCHQSLEVGLHQAKERSAKVGWVFQGIGGSSQGRGAPTLAGMTGPTTPFLAPASA